MSVKGVICFGAPSSLVAGIINSCCSTHKQQTDSHSSLKLYGVVQAEMMVRRPVETYGFDTDKLVCHMSLILWESDTNLPYLGVHASSAI